MIYTLFVWTVVAAYGPNGHGDVGKAYYDWRSFAEIASISEDALSECRRVARELNISREHYRCVRTK